MRASRRTFVKQSALAGGVFCLGFDWFDAKAQVQVSALPEAGHRFNSYLQIDAAGKITLLSPNPEIGQGIKTAFPVVVAEEMDVDWKDVQVLQADLDTKLFERQLTGGSGALKHSWDLLRKAGASARQMFISAAAQQWKVSADQCRTSKGVVYGPAGQQASYGSLAALAATQAVPSKVNYKNRKDYHLIGSFVKGVDNPGVVTGKPMYGIDYKKDGMVLAQIVRPPAFGSKLKSFDASEVLKMPGILEVKSFKDKVAIVGKSTWEIMEARKKLQCQYQHEKPLESNDTHQKWFEDGKTASNVEVMRRDGDVAAAFQRAAKVVEATYECPFISHSPMEPMNFFADVQENRVHLAGPTQVPQSAQKAVSNLLGIPEANVSVELTKMGGGFGRRLNNDFVLEAAELSRLIKKPVKVIWTREDDMMAGIYRPAARYYFRAALDAQGEMIGFHLRGVGLNTGNATRQDNFPVGAIENVLVENINVKSDVTTGPWRAPITNFLAFAEQAFLDEVAEKAGKDPIQMRLNWLQRVKTNPVGKITYEPDRFIEIIKQVAEKAGWGKKKEVALGFSMYYSHFSYVAQIAEAVKENGKPKVRKLYAVTDCGEVINKSGAENQVKGAIVDGIGHAMYAKLDFVEGVAQQKNFNEYKLIRGNEIPEVDAYFVDNGITPTGLGEPALPPTGGAIANALYGITKQRFYKQPFQLEYNIS